jgi:hypothetical protein
MESHPFLLRQSVISGMQQIPIHNPHMPSKILGPECIQLWRPINWSLADDTLTIIGHLVREAAPTPERVSGDSVLSLFTHQAGRVFLMPASCRRQVWMRGDIWEAFHS